MAIGAPSESPAIVVKEVDLTGGVPNVQSTTGAFAGAFRWGPIEQPVKVGDEATLSENFGAPSDSFAVDYLSAAYFLKYSNSLHVCRASGDSAKNASTTEGKAKLIKTRDDWDNGTHADSDVMWAKWAGEFGNSLQVVWTDATNWPTWVQSYKDQFDDAPSGEEHHVLVLDQDGVITGSAGSVLERFPYVSATPTATNADGSSNYMKTIIDRSSEYIWLHKALDSTGSHSLQGGADAAPANADYLNAFDQFEDKDTIQLDFLIAPGKVSSVDQDTLVDDLVAIAQEKRKDCVVVTSPSKTSVVGNTDPVSATVTEAGGYTYSSYLVIDNNHLKVYDKYNDKFIFIPAASSTAGIMAASDNNTAPWFSPAGSRRGAYLGVTSLAYTPTKTQRDTLYKAGINPIANLPGQGILLYGDKTHMNRPSAFDRINVRRLFNVLERAIALAARNTLFELNDEFTRAEFVNIVEPFLREVKGRRGITDFRVVCDETNNTPTVVDRNEFIANIFIKPARSINYITLNFVAVRSGVDFEEVAGLQV